jgi:hypothetical protein
VNQNLREDSESSNQESVDIPDSSPEEDEAIEEDSISKACFTMEGA